MLDNLNNSWFLLLNAHNGDADIVRLAAVSHQKRPCRMVGRAGVLLKCKLYRAV